MKKLELLTKYTLGSYELKNRLVMAPMTRNRAGEGNVPTKLNAEYYIQRSTAGLIITEAAQVSPQGVGYPNTPGIHSQQQVEGWKKVTSKVHENKGLIFLQLWHVGRISHPDFHNGELPVAPSAVKPAGKAFTSEGFKDFVTPKSLELKEISKIVEQYKIAAQKALEAGFDGVEIHGANGYLIDQFLLDGTNKRTDEYGITFENRTRFAFEIIEAIVEVWGSKRVGIRLSPSGIFNDMFDSNPIGLYTYFIDKLNEYNLAYIHLIEPMMPLDPEIHSHYLEDVTSHFRKIYNGTIITNSGYDKESGNRVISEGHADLVSYGKLFISNPDLPKRFELNAELTMADENTFYGGDEEGYTDYAFLEDIKEKVS